MTIFKQIIDREIPADIVYEDELCLAFRDINPQARVHVVLIPKKEIRSLAESRPEDQSLLGHLMLKVQTIAQQEGILESGFRLVANARDDGGQTVDHLHFHILGGRSMHWPPG